MSFYDEAEQPRGGGMWVKLGEKGHRLVGTLIADPDKRVKTFEGQPVKSKAGNLRYEWIVTLQVDSERSNVAKQVDPDDNGVRHFAMNEWDTEDFTAAWISAGKPNPMIGWTVGIACTEKRPRPTERDIHAFKFIEPPTPAFVAAANDAASNDGFDDTEPF